jgi:hypothetical protein
MVEPPRFGEAAHLQRVFDDGAAAGELWLVRTTGDRHHGQVNVGRKATVQTQLGRAARVALVECAVVEEGQGERLLDLVGELAGQQQP